MGKEIKRVIGSAPFLVTLSVTIVFMLMTNVEITEPNGESVSKSLLLLLVTQDREWFIQQSISRESIFFYISNMEITEMVTILASLPFLYQFCEERKRGVLRYKILRQGKWKYYISKCITCVCSGAMVFGMATMVFWAILCVFLPGMEILGGENQEAFYTIYQTSFSDYFRTSLIGFLVYGAIAALPGFVIAAFTYDIYLCIVLPFLGNYMLILFHSWLYSRLNTGNVTVHGWKKNWLEQLYQYGTLDHFFWGWHEENRKGLILFGLIVVVVCGIVFCVRMNKRRDLGE